MKFLRRVITALCGLSWIAMAGVVLAMLLNHSFSSVVLDGLFYGLELVFVERIGIWWAMVGVVLCVLIGILILIVAFHTSRMPKVVNTDTLDGGSVEVSLSAIDSVVRRACNGVPGIQNLSTTIRSVSGELYVVIKLSLPAAASVQETCAEIRREVMSELESMVGIVAKDVRVKIEDIIGKPEAAAGKADLVVNKPEGVE